MIKNMKKNFLLDTSILGFVSLTSCVIYLLFSSLENGWGFPLDDAWIHHTFARNFAETLQWSFQLNQLSGGSTGPAWGLLLAILYLANVPPVIGTFILGFLLLWGTAITGYVLVGKINPDINWLPLCAGLILALEWHIVWAALSGMETLLLILLSIILFIWLIDQKDNWWLPGVMIGLSAWIRPDGLTLVGPAVLGLLLRSYPRAKKIKNLGLFSVGLVAACSTYFLFNWFVIGDIWPNTFYAKQAEYSVLRQAPLLLRYFNLSAQFLTGVGALLLPGIVFQLYNSIKNHHWDQVNAFVWSVGYIGLFAWRLPVIYQHGRYIMPAIPISLLLGISGLMRYFSKEHKKLFERVVSRAWLGSTALILLIFLFLGGQAYGMDVAIINSEMVNTAQWIRDNLDDDAVIAAHDIGAIGYFSERKIIDLAGLVTPDVIPFIRDEKRLGAYMHEQKVDYLVTFPSWYPELTSDLEVLYNTDGIYAPQLGMDNMAVFEWK